MTIHQEGKKIVNDSVERIIAEYLCQHPDFFNRHLELLEQLRIPHPCRPAVSLLERQLMLLRQQNIQLRRQLRDLVKVARDNDCLSRRMQHLNMVLIESRSLDEMIPGIKGVLRDEFSADFTCLRLRTVAAAQGVDLPDRLSNTALSLFASVFESGQPQCGRLTQRQLEYLFEDCASQISSVALLPLQGLEWKGLIGIGSRDEKRFHPGIGTLFLSRIGELISHALQPHLQYTASLAASGGTVSGQQEA